MNSVKQTAMMEHIAVAAPLSLREFCDRCRKILDLPEFTYDSENETEWGIAETQDTQYNISRPYEVGTIQEWDDTVPDDCNFGISLILLRSHPNAQDHDWAVNYLVTPVAQKFANEFSIPVHYHCTWFGVGNNVPRNTTFNPNVA
ncbi:MAG: hypothetical protein NXI22_16110 [bacterium]|nr:hypothetical protein [bacterium]